MGNKKSGLREIANNVKDPSTPELDEKDPDQDDVVNESVLIDPFLKKAISIPPDLNLEALSFEEKTPYALMDIAIEDKLAVLGWFRKEVTNKYENAVIPSGIMQYVIMYLFYINENTLFIGNIHKKVDGNHNQHLWTMFISTSDKELKAPKTVKQVIYYLHPTFHPSDVTVDKSPFLLGRRGWGTFDVEAKIIFDEKYNKPDCYTSHSLSFSNFATLTKVDLKQSIKVSKDMKLWYASSDRETIEYQRRKEFPVDEKYHL